MNKGNELHEQRGLITHYKGQWNRQKVFKSLSSSENFCSIYQTSWTDRNVISILHKTGVLLILKLRRINQFLVAWVSLSLKFHNYTKSGFRVFIDFVKVQTFISPMSISLNIQQPLLFWLQRNDKEYDYTLEKL